MSPSRDAPRAGDIPYDFAHLNDDQLLESEDRNVVHLLGKVSENAAAALPGPQFDPFFDKIAEQNVNVCRFPGRCVGRRSGLSLLTMKSTKMRSTRPSSKPEPRRHC